MLFSWLIFLMLEFFNVREKELPAKCLMCQKQENAKDISKMVHTLPYFACLLGLGAFARTNKQQRGASKQIRYVI